MGARLDGRCRTGRVGHLDPRRAQPGGAGRPVLRPVRHPRGPRRDGPHRALHRGPGRVPVAPPDDRRTLLVALAVMAIAFFVLPTRVHERYLFPFFALGAVLVAVRPRWAAVYAVLAIANIANLYGILTVPFYENLGLGPLLGAFGGLGARLGEAARSTAGVTAAAVAHAGGLLAAVAFLARPARGETDRALDDDVPVAPIEDLPAVEPPLGAAAGVAGGATAAAGPLVAASAGPAARGPCRARRASGSRAPARPCAVAAPPARGRGAHVRRRGARPLRPLALAAPRGRRPARPPRPVVPRRARRRDRSSCGPSGSASRCACTSTRSTTRGRRPSSCRTGATASPTRSTSTPTRTWRST